LCGQQERIGRHAYGGRKQLSSCVIGHGIAAGAIGGIALAWFAGGYIEGVRIPGALPIAGAATILVAAAILASLLPAARASRVDVIQALRSD
jgi:ABC-type antimicrobial peptide transport system permease subunit